MQVCEVGPWMLMVECVWVGELGVECVWFREQEVECVGGELGVECVWVGELRVVILKPFVKSSNVCAMCTTCESVSSSKGSCMMKVFWEHVGV